MILRWLFEAFVEAVNGLTAALPSLPSIDPADYGGTGSSGAMLYAGWLDWYLPVWPAVSLAGVLALAYVGLQTFRVIEYLGTKAHIFGGSSS